ncbi:hypothetical protein GOODEAATRI_012254 [Goodea atripinnis]|uniref:Uncharacterized protein n=1 Tax=Goodea atripinnis TaxID=208336 RepID=A0ABV0MHD4_9TELE
MVATRHSLNEADVSSCSSVYLLNGLWNPPPSWFGPLQHPDRQSSVQPVNSWTSPISLPAAAPPEHCERDPFWQKGCREVGIKWGSESTVAQSASALSGLSISLTNSPSESASSHFGVPGVQFFRDW